MVNGFTNTCLQFVVFSQLSTHNREFMTCIMGFTELRPNFACIFFIIHL